MKAGLALPITKKTILALNMDFIFIESYARGRAIIE
jgi:hypothetical protein